MITGPIIAETAALVGDPARATMMSALLDGRALTASELALAARITPPTASAHLAKLTAAGLLSVARSGRHRYFRLASPKVVEMIEGIVAVALEKRPRYPPLSDEARALNAARICYDHLAGRLSVDLTDVFVARKYVALEDEGPLAFRNITAVVDKSARWSRCSRVARPLEAEFNDRDERTWNRLGYAPIKSWCCTTSLLRGSRSEYPGGHVRRRLDG